MRRIKRQTMECCITNFDRWRTLVQKMNVWPQITVCFVIQKRIVIAPDQHGWYASLRSPRQLSDQEGAGFKVGISVVENIAHQHKRIDLLRYCQVNNFAKGVAAGLFEPVTQIRVAQCG